MKKLSLLEIKEGRKFKVVEVSGGTGVQNKMMSMGIYPGREITKHGHFALRGPITLKVGRSVVALGHALAAKIIVEAV